MTNSNLHIGSSYIRFREWKSRAGLSVARGAGHHGQNIIALHQSAEQLTVLRVVIEVFTLGRRQLAEHAVNREGTITGAPDRSRISSGATPLPSPEGATHMPTETTSQHESRPIVTEEEFKRIDAALSKALERAHTGKLKTPEQLAQEYSARYPRSTRPGALTDED